MKIVFVYPGNESIGLEVLSAVLNRHGHETRLAFDPMVFGDAYLASRRLGKLFDYEARVVEQVAASEPGLVAFSVTTDYYDWASRLARQIKLRCDVPVVFGGMHPTSVPEQVIENESVDVLCIGEGEGAILDLVNQIESNGTQRIDAPIPNLWIKSGSDVIKGDIRPLVEDLDGLPFADKSLFYQQIPVFRKHYTIMMSRGCPFSCTFCCNSLLKSMSRGKGRYLRWRSVGNVIEELARAKRRWHYRTVAFYDDVFTFNKQWIREFLPLYREEIGRPFACVEHPRTIDDEIVGLLKEAGCVNIQLGVQSLNEKTRKEVLGRPETNEEIRESLRLIKRHGIGVTVDHIAEIPRETEEDQIEAVRFYNETRPTIINFFWLSYYPNTEICKFREAGSRTDSGSGSLLIRDPKTKMGNPFAPFESFLNLLPLTPRWLVRFLLVGRRYRFFSRFPTTFAVILPRLISASFHNDIRSRAHVARVIHLVKYALRRTLPRDSGGRRKGTLDGDSRG
jgi:pyruvate-formate lyase-activating enzyme